MIVVSFCDAEDWDVKYEVSPGLRTFHWDRMIKDQWPLKKIPFEVVRFAFQIFPTGSWGASSKFCSTTMCLSKSFLRLAHPRFIICEYGASVFQTEENVADGVVVWW